MGDRTIRETEVVQQWENIPSEATPMEVTLLATGQLQWQSATYVLVSGQPPIGTFREFVDTLPSWERELLFHIQTATDAFAIGVALEHGLRAVSDGSEWFKTLGSFGVDPQLGCRRTPCFRNGTSQKLPTQFVSF